MSRTVRFALAGLVPVLLGLGTSSARAHESPHGIQLTWTSEEPGALPFVLTNRGLVMPNVAAQDGAGSRYSLRCNEAYGVNTSASPIVLHDDKGALVMATSASVSATSDRGCTWQPGTGLPDISLGGFFQDQSAPNKLLITTQVYDTPSQLFTSSDFGRSWTVLGTNNPYTVYRQLLASADGQRVFASGNRYDLANKDLLAMWGTSSDGGKTWLDQDLASERYPLAFHPTDNNVVFAREPNPMLTLDPRDKLLRSEDGGKTFTVVGELPPIKAFASTPDGSTMWVGSSGGLFESSDQGKTFARVADDQITGITCLHYRQDTLWLCANFAPNTNGIWKSSDLSATFQEHLLFTDVATEVSCQPDAAPICETLWRDWLLELRNGFSDAGVPSPDAGSLGDASINDAGAAPVDEADAGLPLDAGEPTRAKKSDGCSAGLGVGTSSWSSGWWLASLGLLVARRRKRT